MTTLIEQLNHPDRNVRSAAALSLGKAGDTSALSLLLETLSVEPDFFVREDITWAVVRMKDAAVPLLIDYLQHENPAARHHAAHVLGKIGDEGAVDGLINVLSDSEPMVLSKAAFSLGQIGDARAVPALIQLLGHENREVHAMITTVLERFNVIEPLIAALGHERWQVREQAVDILGLTGDETTVPVLVRAFEDEHWQVRFAVVTALKHIGGSTAKKALQTMKHDPDRRVSSLASA